MYNPTIGRWLSRDPAGEAGGDNLYAYCQNDPINWDDPSGMLPDKVVNYLSRLSTESTDPHFRDLATQVLSLEGKIRTQASTGTYTDAPALFQQEVELLKQIGANGRNAWQWAQEVAKEEPAPAPSGPTEGMIRGQYPNPQIYHNGQWMLLEGYTQDVRAAEEMQAVGHAYVRGYIDVAVFAATEGLGELLPMWFRGAEAATAASRTGEVVARTGEAAQSLSKAQRLGMVFEQVGKAPAARTAQEAMSQLNETLESVEDAYSGVPKDPNPPRAATPRMYPPQGDSIVTGADGSITAQSRYQTTVYGSNGSITVTDTRTGQVIFQKAGGG